MNLSNVAITTDGDSSTYPHEEFPVLFDTGSTVSYLPNEMVEALAEDLGAEVDEKLQVHVAPCDQEGTLHFTFGNYTIDVALNDFVWKLPSGKCLMGAAADDSDDPIYTLGASFLRSVYSKLCLFFPLACYLAVHAWLTLRAP